MILFSKCETGEVTAYYDYCDKCNYYGPILCFSVSDLEHGTLGLCAQCLENMLGELK